MNLRALNKTHKKAFKGKTIPLIDLCLAISDCPHYTPNWTESGELVIRNFNIKNGRLDLTERYYTDKETFLDRIKRHKPESGDLIITREAPMGEVCIIPEEIECCLGQRMVLIKPNPQKVNNRYLLYAMLSEFVQKQIKKSDSSGSIVSNLCIPDLEQLNIPYIPLTEQEKVASILNPIFESIEVNDRINTELENFAKAIYNYWFVQFDFPNEEGKPYKTSGGAMEWNDELKREIPMGWSVQNLKENCLCEIIKPGIEYFGTEKTYLATADVNDLSINFNADKIIFENRESRANMQPMVNTVWFAKMKNSRKILFIGDYSRFLIENMIFSTGFMGLKCIDKSMEYILSFIINDDFEVLKDRLANGATQQAVNNDSLILIPLIIPSDKILEMFQKMMFPIFKRLYENQMQTHELINLRDFLLPMLMNGQVKVKSEENEQLSLTAEPQVKYGK